MWGSKRQRPHGLTIEDYGLIGDSLSAALVGRNGSIDWLCWPNFSSPACFAALLGTAEHGHWKIAPRQAVLSSHRRYHPGSMVIETVFKTAGGVVSLIDFMPAGRTNSSVVRLVRCLAGRVSLRMDLVIRFDYGKTIPWVTRTSDGLRAISGPDMLLLRTPVALRGEGMATVAEFTLHAGQEAPFTLVYAPSIGEDGGRAVREPEEFSAALALDDTLNYWAEWNRKNQYQGAYREAVQRSLMTLKAMIYRPSGGIVASVTTSLPEKVGGKRNWDYRYCWLRDTSFTLLVLLSAGYDDEARSWRRWLLRSIAAAPSQLQTIYGICGERQLVEREIEWLPGYRDSRPVNVGNAASGQFQLDVFGEVVAALAKTTGTEDDIAVSASAMQAELVDHLCHVWDQPDDGIWETRGGRKHFTYSKVMAWVALDRAIKHYEQYDGGGDVKRWKKNREMLHRQICAKGFSKRRNSFTQYYGSKQLDASCLLIGLVGFLPMDDPRIIGTVEAIHKSLSKDGLIERYDTRASSDGLPAGEGTFIACSFWMVSCLWLIGRRDEATALFERLLGLRNDLGLLSEEWDPVEKQMLGNFPQGLSHIAMVHAAFIMAGVVTPGGATQKT